MFIVTKEIDGENIGKLCRTCLRENGEKMVCLFSGPAGSSLAAKLRTLSSLEVWQGDGLPEKLCDRCVTRAESALLYREQCRAADSALRQAVSKVSSALPVSKVYPHGKHEPRVLQNSHESFKCAECDALFSSYQELGIHAGLHARYVRENRPVQHMNIVESQVATGYAETTDVEIGKTSGITESPFPTSNVVENSTAAENNLAACALHCTLCDRTFVDRSRLVNHRVPVQCRGDIENSCGREEDDDEDEDDDDDVDDDDVDDDDVDDDEDEDDDDGSIITDVAQNHNLVNHDFSVSVNDRAAQNVIENLSYRPHNDETTIGAINYSSGMGLVSSKVVSNEGTRTNVDSGERASIVARNDDAARFGNFDRVRVKENTHATRNKNSSEESGGGKRHACNVCEKSFAQRSKLFSHALSHTGEKPFACSTCDKAYTSKSKLNAHNRLHTRTNVHRCEICDKTFPYPSYLSEHSRIHETVKNDVPTGDHECTICNKQFRSLKNLKIHERLHTGKGLVRCEICHKTFGQKYNLKIHLTSHGVIGKFFKCDYCGKSFAARGNYVEHLRIHTRLKPFECRICDKRFSQSSHRKTHEISHDSTRAHQCRLCGKRYKLAAHLRRHAAGTHTSPGSYKCEECDRSFSHPFSLKRHSKRHSEARVS